VKYTFFSYLFLQEGRSGPGGQLRAKYKGPELGISGPALRGVGDGRGLVARDAVCIGFNILVSDPLVQ
jgi:hypothetical protein